MTDVLRRTANYSLSNFSRHHRLHADEYINDIMAFDNLAKFCKKKYPTAITFSVDVTAGQSDIWINIIPGQPINAVGASSDDGYFPIDEGIEVYADDAPWTSDQDAVAQELCQAVREAFSKQGMKCALF